MENLKDRAVRGGFAKVSAQAVNFVLRMGSLVVLARLLDPKDFGLVGMVTAVTGVFALFRDAGLSMVTIQRPTISDAQVSTLFWLNMLLGVVLALLSAAAAPVLTAFYREPELFWVSVALGSGFLINAGGVQHSALLQRRMRFGALAAIEVAAQVASASVGIGMAMLGLRHWALVAAALASPAISTACVWLIAHWRPGKPQLDRDTGSMVRFGSVMTLNSLVVYAAYNVDKLLLGRVWGADALGIYGRAYQLVNIPTDNLNNAIGGVAISALARLHDEPARFKSYFLKGYSLVVALTIPITTACALFADDIVVVLLGEKWIAAIPIFRLLAPTILTFAMTNPLSWLLLSTGRVRRSLHMAFVIAPIVVAGYAAGLPYGPTGVAFGYSAAMLILVLPIIVWGLWETGITASDMLKAVVPAFGSSIAAGVVAFGVRALCSDSFPLLVRLSLEAGTLFTSYALILLYATGQKAFYYDLVRDLVRQRSSP
jgi:O-antigen/teichoic acid export membrane protein